VKLPSRYTPRDTEDFDSGGMSSAVLCDDGHLARPVVIKSLKEYVNQRRILDELQALQGIRSKHVVQVYDVITESDGSIGAIVEEFIPGDELTTVKPPQSSDEFCRLAYPIARGIAHIHAHGIIHRDIKRQNMKFDAEGCLKIFDFGLARRDDPEDASTIGAWGTPGYMAPELYQADAAGKVSFSSAIDIYAYGATMLALMRGSLPREMRQQPPKLPCADADFSAYSFIPSDLAQLMNATLAIVPSIRPPMAQIADRIGAHLLRDRHRALLISNGQPYELHSKRRKVQLSVAGRGSADIAYNGLEFFITALSGNVAINNMAVTVGHRLPGSCVIALGDASLGTRRTFITVDVSHPEVML
jgi:serine/threonine protein kinase